MSSGIEEGADEPRTVGEARVAIERSRERISNTLDQIEDRIVEKKHELREKVDVLRPLKEQVRQRPLVAVAVAAGVGALLGSLGGGEESEARVRRRGRGRPLDERDRRELREWRRERHARLRALSQAGGRRQEVRAERAAGIKGQLLGAVSTAVTAAIASRVRGWVRGDGRSSARTELP